jgi:hypothetical protein
MLLQADGSRHRWLGPEQPALTWLGAIDAATRPVPWALFRPQADAQGSLERRRQIVLPHGIPLTRYVDRHGSFPKSARAPLP